MANALAPLPGIMLDPPVGPSGLPGLMLDPPAGPSGLPGLMLDPPAGSSGLPGIVLDPPTGGATGREPLPSQTVVGSVGRGIAAAPVSLAQGLTELAAAGIDVAFETNTSRAVTEAFRSFKDDWGLVPERTAGKVAEEIFAFGLGFIPVLGWLGRASAVARGAATAPARSIYARTAEQFGRSDLGKMLLGSRLKLAAGTALGSGILDASITWEGRGTVSDAFEVLPDFLKTEDEDELLGPREEAFRRLRNRGRFGLEGLVIGGAFEAAFPVLGLAGRALAQTPGVPAVARLVHNVVFDKLAGKLGQSEFIRRNFTSAGSVPREAFEALQDLEAIQKGVGSEAARAIKAFTKAAQNVVSSQRLRGKRSFDIKEAHADLMAYLKGDFDAFKVAAPVRGYRPSDVAAMETAARDMRAQIDNLSDMLAKELEASTVLEPEVKARLLADIQNGMGTYVRRLYDAFDNPTRYLDPKTYETPAYQAALDDVTRILKRVRRAQLSQQPLNAVLGLANVAEDQIPTLARKIINDIATRSAVSSLRPFEVALREAHQHIKDGIRLGGQGRIQIHRLAEGIFDPRTRLLDMSAPLREFLGEIKDPTRAFFRTVEDLAQTTTNLRLYESLREQFARPVTTEMFTSGAPRPLVMSAEEVGLVAQELAVRELQAAGVIAREGEPKVLDALKEAHLIIEREAEIMQTLTKGYTALPGAMPQHVEGALTTLSPKNIFGPYGALSHHYVRNDLYEALTAPVRAQALLPDLWSAALMVKSTSQMMTVVMNPVAQVRDALSQAFLLAANGNLHRGLDVVDSARLVFSQLSNMDNSKYREMLNRMEALGVMDQGVVAREIQTNRLDGAGSIDPQSWLARAQKAADRATNVATFGGRAERLYMGTDSMGKIMGVLAEQSKYATAFSKAGLDIDNLPTDVKQMLVDQGLAKRVAMAQGPRTIARPTPGRPDPVELRFSDILAADIVKATMPMYSRVPEFIKSLRRLPLGNFISFPAEILRNTANILDRGLTELGFRAAPELVEAIGETAARVLEREVRHIGANRLLSYISTAAVLPAAVQTAAMRVTGMEEEQMDALMSQVAPWLKGHVLVPTHWDGKGRVEFVDYSYMNPYDFVLAPAKAAMQAYQESGMVNAGTAEQLRRAAWAGISTFAEPFASEAMMVERLMDVLPKGFGREGRTATGAVIYRSTEDLGTRLQKSFSHVIAGILPQFSQYFYRVEGGQWRPGAIMRAVYNTPDNMGKKADMFAEAAAMVTGVKGNEINLRDTFQFSGYEYANERVNVDTSFRNAALDPRATPETVVAAFRKAQEERFRAQSRLLADIEAARKLGMSDRLIRQKLLEDPGGGRGGNLGKVEVSTIMQGRFAALRPSRELARNILRESRNPERMRMMDRLNQQELAQIFREWNRRPLDPTMFSVQSGSPWSGTGLSLGPTVPDAPALPQATSPVYGQPVDYSGTSMLTRALQRIGVLEQPAQPAVAAQPAAAVQPAVAAQPAQPMPTGIQLTGGLLGSNPVDVARNAEIAARL
jgi:hypothetical protein